MKTVSDYFKYLYSLERTGMKYDLNNITLLLKALGNPHRDLKFIHIAGTNGKGATASYAASILMEQGLKTGLFTSPHILEFNERIRVNGKCISDNYVKNFLDSNFRIIKKIKPSFFEVNSAMAFKYFYDKKVDAAVVEAGLGGRLDSTNVIIPEVSVITQIGMDHMQYLGGTLRKITLEKIGIVKKGIDVIVSDNNKPLKRLFKSNIEKKHLHFIDEMVRIISFDKSDKGTKFSVKYKSGKSITLFTPLQGDYQLRNAVTAIESVNRFTYNEVTVAAIRKGISRVIKNSGYFGRLQTINTKGGKYIFDISHNPDGIKAALNCLRTKKIETVIFAIMSDKDYKSSINEILKHFKYILFTKPDYKRALPPEIMMQYARKQRLRNSQTIFRTENVKDALKIAGKIERGKGGILVIGSFFLVSDAIKALGLLKYF